ncbi:ABC transporter substrate-binding protein [uncultured Ellagibacter sp.]|uniref:ABC transporter substrate-binding protein n=1 Tax=uncultured Ellagibacter sp. TaxID=2137580 RepID=UPI0025E9A32B|nr:ABC transporter substrate-binding protein [uncultured Ellagibacter sp.]
MEKLTRRSFVKGAAAASAVVAAGAAMAGCGSNDTSAKTDDSKKGDSSSDKIPMTIGYWGGNCCELAVYVAIENNCFQDNGIEPNVVTITADTSELLANDEIDFFLWTPGFFLSWLQGANAKLIDTMHTGCWSGITLEGNGIDSAADLKGKKVGCTGMSGPSYVESNALYSRATGGKGSEDINWTVYDGSLLLQALKDHEVDAIIGIDSTLYPQVKDTEGAKFFFISAQELSDYYCCFVCCNSHTLEKHPEAGDRLAKAFADADDILRKDVDAAVEMAIEKGYTVGKYPNIEKGLAKNYLYGHGNEEDFKASIYERWDELRVAGFLTDCPTDEAKAKEYLQELTEGIAEWHGDVGKATAAKKLSEQVKTRGDAFGTNPEDVKNA